MTAAQPLASPFHMFTVEVWPDPMPAASWPMLVPDRLTIKATDAAQAGEFAAQAIKPGQRATVAGHIRSKCWPPHPGS